MDDKILVDEINLNRKQWFVIPLDKLNLKEIKTENNPLKFIDVILTRTLETKNSYYLFLCPTKKINIEGNFIFTFEKLNFKKNNRNIHNNLNNDSLTNPSNFRFNIKSVAKGNSNNSNAISLEPHNIDIDYKQVIKNLNKSIAKFQQYINASDALIKKILNFIYPSNSEICSIPLRNSTLYRLKDKNLEIFLQPIVITKDRNEFKLVFNENANKEIKQLQQQLQQKTSANKNTKKMNATPVNTANIEEDENFGIMLLKQKIKDLNLTARLDLKLKKNFGYFPKLNLYLISEDQLDNLLGYFEFRVNFFNQILVSDNNFYNQLHLESLEITKNKNNKKDIALSHQKIKNATNTINNTTIITQSNSIKKIIENYENSSKNLMIALTLILPILLVVNTLIFSPATRPSILLIIFINFFIILAPILILTKIFKHNYKKYKFEVGLRKIDYFKKSLFIPKFLFNKYCCNHFIQNLGALTDLDANETNPNFIQQILFDHLLFWCIRDKELKKIYLNLEINDSEYKNIWNKTINNIFLILFNLKNNNNTNNNISFEELEGLDVSEYNQNSREIDYLNYEGVNIYESIFSGKLDLEKFINKMENNIKKSIKEHVYSGDFYDSYGLSLIYLIYKLKSFLYIVFPTLTNKIKPKNSLSELYLLIIQNTTLDYDENFYNNLVSAEQRITAINDSENKNTIITQKDLESLLQIKEFILKNLVSRIVNIIN
ncbi:MAG: hypothetical protein ACTSRZ_19140 [Promethearchaeota archaeon]